MTRNRLGASNVDDDGITLIRWPLAGALTFQFMADAHMHILRNSNAPWNTFSPDDYWRWNYSELQAEDQEIIDRVSHFFVAALAGRPRVRQGIDVGSGTNLYPSLLMLPWTEKILLSDFAASNVDWLRHHVVDDTAAWTWQPFWHELYEVEGYNQIGAPRKQLREACAIVPGFAGIEQRSVFDR